MYQMQLVAEQIYHSMHVLIYIPYVVDMYYDLSTLAQQLKMIRSTRNALKC